MRALCTSASSMMREFTNYRQSFENRTNIAESSVTHELSRGYLVSPLYLPFLPECFIKAGIKTLLDLDPDSPDSTYSASFLTPLGPSL